MLDGTSALALYETGETLSLAVSRCSTERAWMIDQLSYTPHVVIEEDSGYHIEREATSYYLDNDEWRASHFFEMSDFADDKGKGGFKPKKAIKPGSRGGKEYRDYIMRFRFNNPELNLEMKFVFHQLIFRRIWSLNTACFQGNQAIKKFASFINECHPEFSSIIELDYPELQEEFEVYLAKQGYNVLQNHKLRNKQYAARTTATKIPTIICERFKTIMGEYRALRNPERLWENDIWKGDQFRVFGIDAVRTSGSQTIDFSGIDNQAFRDIAKRYLKERLLSHSITWSTANSKLGGFKNMANFIHEKHPEWVDFQRLSRKDILDYQEYLGKKATTRKRAGKNPIRDQQYAVNALTVLRTILRDLQMLGFKEAPTENVYVLIRTEDTYAAHAFKAPEIKYVPDTVVEQLFANFDKLGENWQPIILTLFYTGIRVSDVLELRDNCLVTVNGHPMIETNIRKTKIEGHRIPIPDDFAAILKNHIEKVRNASNEFTNPDHFIFVHLSGPRRGYPYSHASVHQALNELAITCNITDEDGNIYHFKNHAFRHTYAVRLLNNGAGLTTVQELLGHRSPEMTLVYAKLLDETKFREFEKAVKNGAFTFGDSTGIEIVYTDDVPEELLRNAWANHKYNAVDTPYGTCLQRKNGRCRFASQPPCLTCNDGRPCNDLCIGAFDGDIEKYEIMIESTSKIIEMARLHNREDTVEENKKVLASLEEIKAVLDKGGIIYGRSSRLKETQ